MTINNIHHKNPSGLHNKVSFLLSYSKWDKEYLNNKLVYDIYINPSIIKSCNSWIEALKITNLILDGNIEGLKETRYKYWLKKPRIIEEIE